MLLFQSIKRVILRLFLNKRMTMLQENGTHKIKLWKGVLISFYNNCDAEHWSENQTFPKGAILT